LRPRDVLGGRNRDNYKRSSLCSEDEVPRGWSPTAVQNHQPDFHTIEDYEDYEPPALVSYQVDILYWGQFKKKMLEFVIKKTKIFAKKFHLINWGLVL